MEDCFVYKKYETKHKMKPAQFASVASGVKKRLEKNLKYRKSCRLTVFDDGRDMSNYDSPPPEVDEVQLKYEHRRQQLQKWKEEREKKKKEEVVRKKKPFVVGVAHASLKYEPPPPLKLMASTSSMVTRSQSARNNAAKTKPKAEIPKLVASKKEAKTQSFAPSDATFKPPQLKAKTKKLMQAQPKTKPVQVFVFEPVLPKTRQTRSRAKKNSQQDNIMSVSQMNELSSPPVERKVRTPRKSIQKNVANVTPKDAVPKSESSSEEKLRPPKNLLQKTPEQFVHEVTKLSPRITLSRGKDNARKEMMKKLDEGLLDEDVSDMDSVQHFRRQYESEIAHMTKMCDDWERLLGQISLPDFAQEQVLATVGQARLLMSQKMRQFSGLVQRCAAQETGAARVTPADLQGFWDMVFIQIVNVDLRFKKLEELQARDWQEEEEEVVVQKKVVRRNRGRKVGPTTAQPSRLREVIAAARKAKMDSDTASSQSSEDESKTFEAGFFSVKSPVKSAQTPSTPKDKASLLKAVLSNEARKSANKNTPSSYAMLRASIIGKNIEIDGVEPLKQTPKLPSIDLNATPARSILKSAKKQTTERKSGKKSIKAVLFDEPDQDLEEKNTELRTEMNTDSGLSSIDQDNGDSKENKGKNEKKFTRQNALDESPVMTRSRRKSVQDTPKTEETPKRRQKKVLKEIEVNMLEEQVSSRTSEVEGGVSKATPRRSSRRVMLDLIDFVTPSPRGNTKRGKNSKEV